MIDMDSPQTIRRRFLNEQLGVPSGTRQVFDRMVDLTRRVGQTVELVMGLPADGRAIVFVANHGMGDEIKRWCQRLRGTDYPVTTLRFASFKGSENDGRLYGLGWPVFVDNSAWYTFCRNELERLNALYGPREEQ